MPTLQIFVWKLCHASLTTRANLRYRGMQIEPTWPHSNEKTESIEHLFWGCQAAQQVWQLTNNHNWAAISVSYRPHVTMQSWITSIRQPNRRILDRVVAFLWSLWKTRNNKIFRNETPNVVIMLLRAKKASEEWCIWYDQKWFFSNSLKRNQFNH